MPSEQRQGSHHALVCGASAGIGRAASLALARRGARVTVLARSRGKLEALMPELQAAGAAGASFIVADHDDRNGLTAAVERLLVERPVDILVNNSGGPPPGPILAANDDDFLAAFSRHVLASHLLVRLVLPGMREAKWGRIVNVISTSVFEPIADLGVSNTTRAAMAGWAKSVSKELPPGVTINNVLPGFTATDRLFLLRDTLAERGGKTPAAIEAEWRRTIPEGRLAAAEEVGEVIAFLCSEAASYVRGQSLAVDGGRMQRI